MNMSKTVWVLFLFGLFLGQAIAPGQAQAPSVVWVSSAGADANNCSKTMPCLSLQRALLVLDGYGTVKCLDNGPYGGGVIQITKSVTISCKETGALVIHPVTIEASGIDVVLRGLEFDVSSTANQRIVAVVITQPSSVTIEDCGLRDIFQTSGSLIGGIHVRHTAGHVSLRVSRCTIANITAGPAIRIQPTGIGSADVMIANSLIADNNVGIRVDTTQSSGRTDVNIVDTVTDGNKYQGLVAEGGAGPILVHADRLTASNNHTQGVRAINSTATVRLANSAITGNNIGTETLSGGVIQSYGNNRIIGNVSNGPALPLIGQQ